MGNTLSNFISPPALVSPPVQQPFESDMYLIKIMGPTRAGKTSILQKIKDPNAIINPASYTPNITCELGIIRSPVPHSSSTQDGRSSAQKKQVLMFFDTSDSERLRIFNSSFLRHTHGITFVIDASPQDGQTREEYVDEASKSLKWVIHELANHDQDQPLLMFVNKQDRPDSMTAEEVIELLHLKDIFSTSGRRWFVQEASALRGEGIAVGFAWLLAQMQDRRANPGL
ncbi:ADP-ribosylation factor protein 3 [Mortierella hygrophila]|uniref:ADP-ribosylation factor protein 3 n=1 Tax=Mortierella hygrophila TaxID=979708 RepID=A0A9P6K2C9_9FUNG|nr:ADP-ribosylation factor protein 3 [Mortierella hygrophila]